MSASQRIRCLSEMDIFGENVLHVASKSKASGFSRHLLTTSRHNRHKTNRHKSMQINRELGVSTAHFDFDHTASFQKLNNQKTVESTDLELLLHAGTESGLNIDAWLSVRNEWGETPLMVGCRGGRVDVVRMLMEMVESEEEVAFETAHNMTCLQVAAVRGHTDVVQLLLEKAAKTTKMVRFDLQSNGASSFSSFSFSSSSSSTTTTTSFSSFLRTTVVDAFGRDAEITTCQSGRLSTIQLLLHAAILESRKDEFVEKCLNAVANVANGAGDFSNVEQMLLLSTEKIDEENLEKIITERTEEERTEEERRSDGNPSLSTMEGGWNVGEDNNDGSDIYSSRSSVPSLYSDDAVITFLRDYYTLRRPVVFRKSISSRHNKKDGWSSVEAWKKNNFLQKYGKHMCEVSAIPYGELYGQKRTKMTIAEYVRSWEKKSDDESDRSFLFDGGRLYHTTSLQNEIGLPPLALNFTRQHGGARTYLHQFHLGPKGSGAQPHFHGDAWNALIYGRKKWIFHPPPNGEFTTMSVMKSGAMLKQSKTRGRKQGDELSTVQHSGDIVFVPEFWSHATLNLGESIGVAFEFY